MPVNNEALGTRSMIATLVNYGAQGTRNRKGVQANREAVEAMEEAGGFQDRISIPDNSLPYKLFTYLFISKDSLRKLNLLSIPFINLDGRD